VTTFAVKRQSERLASRAAAGAVNSCVTAELGKYVVSKSSKVSSSAFVRLTQGATKDPSLILWSLEIALCNVADIDRLLMEVQKVLQAFVKLS